jgi:hypothetical protein
MRWWRKEGGRSRGKREKETRVRDGERIPMLRLKDRNGSLLAEPESQYINSASTGSSPLQ